MYVTEPVEFKEKVKHKAWQVGMDAKMASIISNITWELCQLPLRKYVVGLKWIYKIKCNVEVVRQKARLVAKVERLQNDEAKEFADPRMYRSLVGKLLYLTHTRADICYVVNYLSRFMNFPARIISLLPRV